MDTIEDLLRDLKALPALVERGVENAIIGDNVDIADVNRDQLAKGLDINNNPLGQYAESTKKIRSKKGLQTAFIDLNFTGKSYKSIDTKEKGGGKFDLIANPRWDVKRFSDAIGISKDGENEVTDIVILNIESLLDQKFT